MSDSFLNISPLDGRYRRHLQPLTKIFSEKSLIYYRLKIEIEYLIALGEEGGVEHLPALSTEEKTVLRNIYKNFTKTDAQIVKDFEKTTNHDVKAVEYFIRTKTNKSLHSWIHFAITSEDVNNLAYTLMWKEGLYHVYLQNLQDAFEHLKQLAETFASQEMLSLTHGQPATPTTFGKEMAVYAQRLNRQIGQIKKHKLMGKFNGATGTWAAHKIAYPAVNWVGFSNRFILSLGLNPNVLTTQVEPKDSLVESYHQIVRVNTILIDLCRDIWFYISRGLLKQKRSSGEVGSSTMPHKINPIQFENAEGNLGIANTLFNPLAATLPISRMQRDLTDSTSLRNQGVALGHAYLALNNILSGLQRISVNKKQMSEELNNHWEVLTEAVQTILRKTGKTDAYEQLKNLSMGEHFDAKSFTDFLLGLDIPDDDKKTLLDLKPKSYLGLALKLSKVFEAWDNK